jgi:hypothetical protein
MPSAEVWPWFAGPATGRACAGSESKSDLCYSNELWACNRRRYTVQCGHEQDMPKMFWTSCSAGAWGLSLVE